MSIKTVIYSSFTLEKKLGRFCRHWKSFFFSSLLKPFLCVFFFFVGVQYRDWMSGRLVIWPDKNETIQTTHKRQERKQRTSVTKISVHRWVIAVKLSFWLFNLSQTRALAWCQGRGILGDWLMAIWPSGWPKYLSLARYVGTKRIFNAKLPFTSGSRNLK